MVFKGSRYRTTTVITPEWIDGSAPRVLSERIIPPTRGVLEYTVVEGERLDQLSQRFYSAPTKYWLILDANPGVLNPFELLQAGAIIRVPQNRIVT